jgi:hypothetical protein
MEPSTARNKSICVAFTSETHYTACIADPNRFRAHLSACFERHPELAAATDHEIRWIEARFFSGPRLHPKPPFQSTSSKRSPSCKCTYEKRSGGDSAARPGAARGSVPLRPRVCILPPDFDRLGTQ